MEQVKTPDHAVKFFLELTQAITEKELARCGLSPPVMPSQFNNDHQSCVRKHFGSDVIGS